MCFSAKDQFGPVWMHTVTLCFWYMEDSTCHSRNLVAEAAGTATSTGSTLPSSCAGKQQVGLCLAAHARPGHCCYQESSYVAGQCHLYRQSDLTALCHPPCPGSIGLWGQLAHSVGSGQLCRFASAATCLHFTTLSLSLLGCRIGCQAHTVGSGKL